MHPRSAFSLGVIVSSVLVLNRHRAGWLRGVAFDSSYIVGIASLAVASGWVVVSNPALFTPVFVLNACLAVGTWILTTVYLYWQWWHYTRQSYGVSRIYQRKAGLNNDLLHKLVIY